MSAREPEIAIEVEGLKKNYGGTEAVKGIDLLIHKGEIFGLIGPDGAGKTTTFQILGGVMEPSSGHVRMLGQNPRFARSYVGYLTQAFSLYLDLSVAENLRYIGELRKVPKSEIRRRGELYLKLFNMEKFTERLAGQLSGGMKQKLALACALIAEPQILLLDEPTTGVDPVSRREFWDTLANFSARGMTIIVATPYLDEAERCNRVALMHDGRINDRGTPGELRKRLGLDRLEVYASELGRAEVVLRNAPGISDVQRFGDRLDLMVRDTVEGEKKTRELLGQAGIGVEKIRAGIPTLENTFVAVLRELGGEVKSPPFPHRQAAAPCNGVPIGGRDLSKAFGDFQAVKNVNLEVKYGEIYGLLGANGAGKTTTIKMLCGLLDPSSGEIELVGEKGMARSSAVRQRIGYMSQKFSLYNDLTVDENLDFFAGVYKVPLAERAEKKRWVMEFAGLEGKGTLLTGSLPGGWKQRVAFGSAVMHEPCVLFLDEPTSGVDPLARRSFWKIINEFADLGVAILVTTHYLEEAEQCNRLGLMVAGELVAQGTPNAIKSEQGGWLIEFFTSNPQAAANLLKREMENWRVSIFGERLHVILDESSDQETEAGIDKIKRMLAGAGIEVIRAVEQPLSLEDVFIAVVEKARKEGKAAIED